MVCPLLGGLSSFRVSFIRGSTVYRPIISLGWLSSLPVILSTESPLPRARTRYYIQRGSSIPMRVKEACNQGHI